MPAREPYSSPRPLRLGDTVALALSSIGITEQRVTGLLGRPCKCKERQRRLNELGQQAAAAIRKATGQEQQHGDKLDDQPN